MPGHARGQDRRTGGLRSDPAFTRKEPDGLGDGGVADLNRFPDDAPDNGERKTAYCEGEEAICNTLGPFERHRAASGHGCGELRRAGGLDTDDPNVRFEPRYDDGRPGQQVADDLGMSLPSVYQARSSVTKMLKEEAAKLERTEFA